MSFQVAFLFATQLTGHQPSVISSDVVMIKRTNEVNRLVVEGNMDLNLYHGILWYYCHNNKSDDIVTTFF